MLLDVKLDFYRHLKNIYSKVNTTIGLLCKLHNALPRFLLLTISKSLIRPCLNYGDIIYGQAYRSSFCEKIESAQYNSVLATAGTISGTSKEKLYQELGLEAPKEDDGGGSCAASSIYTETNPQNVHSISFLLLRDHTTQEC